MSLRAKRRSLIAALTVGGSLAVAGAASAIPVPIGSASDPAYSGTGTPTSVYSIFNASYQGLYEADYALNVAGDPHVPQCSSTATQNVCPGFPAEPGPGISNALTTAQAEQIAADFTDTTINTTKPSGASWASKVKTFDTNYAMQAPQVAAAGTSFGELSGLVTNLGAVTGSVLNSADSATVSSSGTVVNTTEPIAYNIKVAAPTGAYILPSAFQLTFPQGLAVNTGLVADEVNAAANGTSAAAIAAVEANPTGTSIGTVTVTSPLADAFGGSNNQIVGKVYVVTTGQSSGQGSATQPYLELWLGPDIYDLGSFPSHLVFPLTLSFSEAMTPLGPEPLPLSSIAVSFPAATSPVKATSCTSLGTVGGTTTDAIAGLALMFGDTSDGLTNLTGTPVPVQLSATATAVTNDCVAKPKATASGAGLTTGRPTIRVRATSGRAFKTLTIGLPKGLRFNKASAKTLAKEIKGSKVRSVRIVRGKLVIALKARVKSETIKTRRSLISESAGLIRSIKKHRTKRLTLRVGIGSATVKATFKA